MSTDAIDYFGMHSPFVRFKARRSLRARRQMFELFMRVCAPDATSTVVDIGVTPDQELPDSNAFEQFYPHPRQLTATSIEDASFLEQRFPGVRFVRTEGVELPFEDKAFTVAFSSAVLEHVGDRDAQRRFLAEMARVSERFFFTTPNRWFPLELHTFVPFVHWLPQRAHQWILRRLGLRFWAETKNLNLVGAGDIVSLVPPGTMFTIARYRLLGWTSNLIVYGQAPAVVASTPGPPAFPRP